jgi:hypothetical protein
MPKAAMKAVSLEEQMAEHWVDHLEMTKADSSVVQRGYSKVEH